MLQSNANHVVKQYQRENSTPGTVSEEKKSSLQQDARQKNPATYKRSISHQPQPTKQKSTESENFDYICKRESYRKVRSCSDLGSSLSKEDSDILDMARRGSDAYSAGYGTASESCQLEEDQMGLDNKLPFYTEVGEDNLTNLYLDETEGNDSNTSVEIFDLKQLLPVDTLTLANSESFFTAYNNEETERLHNQLALQGISHLLPPSTCGSETLSSSSSETEVKEITSKSPGNYNTEDFCANSNNEIHDKFCKNVIDKMDFNNRLQSSDIQFMSYISQHDVQTKLDKQVSCIVNQMVLEMFQKDKSLEDIEKFMDEHLNKSDLETDCDDVIQNHQEKNSMDCNQNVGVSTEESVIIEQLSMVKQCHRDDCTRYNCQQGKYMYKVLQCDNPNNDDGRRHLILSAVYKHAKNCYDNCNVPYCNFFHGIWFISDEDCDTVADAIKLFDENFKTLFIQPTDEYISLDEGYDSMGLSSNEANYEILTRVHESVYFGERMHLQAGNINTDFIIVKKGNDEAFTPLTLSSIKEIQRGSRTIENLVWSLWAVNPNNINLKYHFSTFEISQSLKEYISRKYSSGMPRDNLHQMTNSLLSALQFLHQKRMLFLNWLSDHVLMSNGLLKLCNLSLAITETEVDDKEISDISLQLAPHVVAPEMFEGRMKFPSTDYWGVGALVFEMATGNHLYQDLHFHNIEDQRERIQKIYKESSQPVFTLNSESDEIRNLLMTSLRKDESLRTLPTAVEN